MDWSLIFENGLKALVGTDAVVFTLAAIGLPWIAKNPVVLGALNPLYAIKFFMHHQMHGFLLLGSVVLKLVQRSSTPLLVVPTTEG